MSSIPAGPPVDSQPPVTIVAADPTTHVALLEAFYTEVMVPSFRPEELGSPYYTDPGTDARTMLALGPDHQVLGGVVGEMYPVSSVLLISWVAVRPGHRGRGIGTLLLRHVAAQWYPQDGIQLVLGELDDPRYWPSAEQDPVARLRFYDRLGVRALTTPYAQPELGAGLGMVHHMFLASFDPAAPAARAPRADGMGAVDGQVVRRFLEEYLNWSARVCGRPGELSPRAEWLLSHYDGTDIPLIPLLDYEQIADPHPPDEGKP